MGYGEYDYEQEGAAEWVVCGGVECCECYCVGGGVRVVLRSKKEEWPHGKRVRMGI